MPAGFKQPQSSERCTGPAKKRVRVSPLAEFEEFSLENVVANTKTGAVAAHLPKTVLLKLFEQDATVQYLTSDHKSWVYIVPRWYWHIFEHTNPEELCSAAVTKSSVTWSAIFQPAWEAHPRDHGTFLMFGRQTKLPRFQQVCGKIGSYRYSGRTFEAQKTYPRD
uniref:Uncharacterized protein n=1 Tax=Peronospora matthiolae TaxID=2874970 RepID=A0AAV1T9B8_9STRA